MKSLTTLSPNSRLSQNLRPLAYFLRLSPLQKRETDPLSSLYTNFPFSKLPSVRYLRCGGKLLKGKAMPPKERRKSQRVSVDWPAVIWSKKGGAFSAPVS
jgi:hypothetical protein